jgi:hypothetical protein
VDHRLVAARSNSGGGVEQQRNHKNGRESPERTPEWSITRPRDRSPFGSGRPVPVARNGAKPTITAAVSWHFNQDWSRRLARCAPGRSPCAITFRSIPFQYPVHARPDIAECLGDPAPTWSFLARPRFGPCTPRKVREPVVPLVWSRLDVAHYNFNKLLGSDAVRDIRAPGLDTHHFQYGRNGGDLTRTKSGLEIHHARHDGFTSRQHVSRAFPAVRGGPSSGIHAPSLDSPILRIPISFGCFLEVVTYANADRLRLLQNQARPLHASTIHFLPILGGRWPCGIRGCDALRATSATHMIAS